MLFRLISCIEDMNSDLDVHGVIADMRLNRCYMVQSLVCALEKGSRKGCCSSHSSSFPAQQEQYKFVYNTMNEALGRAIHKCKKV